MNENDQPSPDVTHTNDHCYSSKNFNLVTHGNALWEHSYASEITDKTTVSTKTVEQNNIQNQTHQDLKSMSSISNRPKNYSGSENSFSVSLKQTTNRIESSRNVNRKMGGILSRSEETKSSAVTTHEENRTRDNTEKRTIREKVLANWKLKVEQNKRSFEEQATKNNNMFREMRKNLVDTKKSTEKVNTSAERGENIISPEQTTNINTSDTALVHTLQKGGHFPERSSVVVKNDLNKNIGFLKQLTIPQIADVQTNSGSYESMEKRNSSQKLENMIDSDDSDSSGCDKLRICESSEDEDRTKISETNGVPQDEQGIIENENKTTLDKGMSDDLADKGETLIVTKDKKSKPSSTKRKSSNKEKILHRFKRDRHYFKDVSEQKTDTPSSSRSKRQKCFKEKNQKAQEKRPTSTDFKQHPWDLENARTRAQKRFCLMKNSKNDANSNIEEIRARNTAEEQFGKYEKSIIVKIIKCKDHMRTDKNSNDYDSPYKDCQLCKVYLKKRATKRGKLNGKMTEENQNDRTVASVEANEQLPEEKNKNDRRKEQPVEKSPETDTQIIAQHIESETIKQHRHNQTTECPEDINWLDYSFVKGRVEYLCKLCPTTTVHITAHYKKDHPESEVLISRLNREEAAKAIREAAEINFNDLESTASKFPGQLHGNTDYQSFNCRMCDKENIKTFRRFFLHVTEHTGEYMFWCPVKDCNSTAASDEELTVHITSCHTNVALNTDQPYGHVRIFEFRHLNGFLCSGCHFVQLFLKNVKEHVARKHSSDENIPIIKINMSSKEPAEQTDDVDKNCVDSVKKIKNLLIMKQNYYDDDSDKDNESDCDDSNEEDDNDDDEAIMTHEFEDIIELENESTPTTSEQIGKDNHVEKCGNINRGQTGNDNPEDTGNDMRRGENTSPNLNQMGDNNANSPPVSVPNRPDSPEVILVDSDDEFLVEPKEEKDVEIKVEWEIGPHTRRKWIVGYLSAQMLNDTDFLYDCFAKRCMFSTRVYINFEKHVRYVHPHTKWEGDCDSCQEEIVSNDGYLTLLNAMEHLMHHVGWRMVDQSQLKTEDSLPNPPNGSDEVEIEEHAPNISEQEDIVIRNSPSAIREGSLGNQDLPDGQPSLTTQTGNETQEENARIRMEEETGNNGDREEQSQGTDQSNKYEALEDIEGTVVQNIVDLNACLDDPYNSSLTLFDVTIQSPVPVVREQGMEGGRMLNDGVFYEEDTRIETEHENSNYTRSESELPLIGSSLQKENLDFGALTGENDIGEHADMELVGIENAQAPASLERIQNEDFFTDAYNNAVESNGNNDNENNGNELTTDRREFRVELSGREFYNCGYPNCTFSDPDEKTLKEHLDVCYHARDYGRLFCVCGKGCWTKHNYITHVKHHGKENYFCNRCEYTTGGKLMMLSHLRLTHYVLLDTEISPHDNQPKHETRKREAKRLELVCPFCKFAMEKLNVFQKHLFQEAWFRRGIKVVTKNWLNDPNPNEENNPDVGTTEAVSVTEATDNYDIKLWVHNTVHRQIKRLAKKSGLDMNDITSNFSSQN